MRRESLHLLGKEIAVKAASTKEVGNRLLVAASLFTSGSIQHHQGILTELCEHIAHRSKLCPHPSKKSSPGHHLHQVHTSAKCKMHFRRQLRKYTSTLLSAQALEAGLGSTGQGIPESWGPG